MTDKKTRENKMDTKEKVEEYYRKKLGEDFDKYDVMGAYYDNTLTYGENIENINEQIQMKEINPKEMAKENEAREKEYIRDLRDEYNNKGKEQLYLEQTNIVIIGKKGSGKTCLGWTFAKKIADESGRKIYIYKYPKPEKLKKLPFKVINITRMDLLFNITDGIVILDEAQEHFGIWAKAVNEDLKRLLSYSRQNNTCFIFICHNSYFLNRSLFSFIDVRIIKETNENHWALERPYMSKLYSSVVVFGNDNFYIDSDYIRSNQTFEKPEWFTEEFSRAYRTETKKEDFFK